MNPIPNVLIISFYFSPGMIVGGKRFSFLAEIFEKQFGVVDVLTLKEKYYISKDKSLPTVRNIHGTSFFPTYLLPDRKPTNSIVKKIMGRIWSNLLCLVDPFSGWIFPAFFKALEIVREKEIDIVIVTGPPFSPMLVGWLLTYISRMKLILDYRDPWRRPKQHGPLVRLLSKFLEKMIVRRASAIVFCSHVMKQEFQNTLGRYTNASLHLINNGFSNNEDAPPLFFDKQKKTMLYAGNFYGERRLRPLIHSLREFLDDGLITRENFAFHILGSITSEDQETICKYGLEDVILSHPFVPYDQMIMYLKGADILYLPSGSDVNYAIPFKFYDYLSVKRPILAVLSRDSAVDTLMREVDCGRVAFVDSEDSIRETLRNMLFENQEYTYSGREKYTWQSIAGQYIDLIRKVDSVK